MNALTTVLQIILSIGVVYFGYSALFFMTFVGAVLAYLGALLGYLLIPDLLISLRNFI